MPATAPSNNSVEQIGRLVRAPKTAELIAAHIRRQIVRGELKPGEKLPSESRLMDQFGVSRPTLREAFRVLETESLISIRRGSRGGAEVTMPDLSVAARHVGLLLQMQGATVADVLEARSVLEPACARRLATRRTKADIDELLECIDNLEEIVEAGPDAFPDPEAWADAAYRFTEVMLERAGNRTLAVQSGVLHEVVATHLSVSLARRFRAPETFGQFRVLVRSYRKFVKLVEARDANGAEKHWQSLLDAVSREMLRDDLEIKRVVDLFV